MPSWSDNGKIIFGHSAGGAAMTEAKAGRPTEYDPKLNRLVEGMFRGGATDNEVIEALSVARSTFYLWKNEHPAFAEAIRRGKDYFDTGRVESALLQAALGSDWQETTVTGEDGGEVRRVTKNKVIPANVAAAKYWLNNRNPERWQDNPEPLDNDRAGVEMFAEMIREMRQEKGREISDKCMKDIENAPNPQAAFVRAAVDIQPG
ncbi:MAG: hypothetical protein D3903_08070 [Candidatus Electrothrix sp. GM3_4]|nr:hypothetical protein [Candidatus Electrothrix sp. GM3_4]